MIEKMKKDSMVYLDNIDICHNNLKQMIINLDNDMQNKSDYFKNFKIDLTNLTRRIENLNKLLVTYNALLSRLAEAEEIDNRIMILKQELVTSTQPEIIIDQIMQLQEERLNIINQAKMLSYE